MIRGDHQRTGERPFCETVGVSFNGQSRGFEFIFGNMDRTEREQLLAIFDGFAWLVPSWCRRIYVDFETPDSGSNATCSVHREYCVANIQIRPDFFTNTPAFQTRIVCHELIHVAIAKLQDGFQGLMRDLMPEGHEAHYERLYSEYLEGTVSDLENAIVTAHPPSRAKPKPRRRRA